MCCFAQDRLSAIDAARRAEADARRAEVDAAADPRENVQGFLTAFEADRARIDAAVEAERAAFTPGGKGVDEVKASLDALSAEVLEMEHRVAGMPLPRPHLTLLPPFVSGA